ncbi:MAG: hypothetical protein LBB30_04910 [Candidatus Methanoplasma sp.]|nr:hypothetical protein [Candidatus Methanoplasma sp.]
MYQKGKRNRKKDREVVLETISAVHEGDGPCTLTVEINNVTGTCGASINGIMKYREMRIKSGYMGERKWRTDYAIPFSHKDACDVNCAFDNYDLVCAIDTNSKLIGGIQITVGSMFKMIMEENIFWSCFVKEFSDYHLDKIDDFEQRNWIKSIEFIQNNYKDATKVLIIVDSDYSNLMEYNAGNKKICDIFRLPIGFTLGYASSDRGDNWMNLLIKSADKYNKERMSLFGI